MGTYRRWVIVRGCTKIAEPGLNRSGVGLKSQTVAYGYISFVHPRDQPLKLPNFVQPGQVAWLFGPTPGTLKGAGATQVPIHGPGHCCLEQGHWHAGNGLSRVVAGKSTVPATYASYQARATESMRDNDTEGDCDCIVTRFGPAGRTEKSYVGVGFWMDCVCWQGFEQDCRGGKLHYWVCATFSAL